MKSKLFAGSAVIAMAFAGSAVANDIKVGHIADLTGATASVGRPYAQGVSDALKFINSRGGVLGRQIDVESTDYAYEVPRAMAAYKKWTSGGKPAAIQGWGTGDTEALISFVAKDEIPYFSASYSGHLTDPAGTSGAKPAPYNFFYGPSYTDGCRGLVGWAAADWKAKGGSGKPKFVHMGDNHPYPNAPKEGCAAYAAEQGFDVLNPIQYSLKPGDFKAQCLSLKESGADYAYLANTSGSTISLLKSCETVGAKPQFMGNIWGMDEAGLRASGEAADGMVWVVAAATWTDTSPGMATIREISKMSDSSGNEARPVHYIRGVCSTFYMKEAMEQAAQMQGGVTGPNIKKAMYQKKDWVPAGMEGVCMPSTWTATDHRGSTDVMVYRASVKGGDIGMTKIHTATVPRRAEWLGK